MSRKPVAATGGSGLRLQDIALASLLLCTTLLAYLPAIRGGVLWDDDGHITKPDLRSLHGLWRIWFEPGATQQYYPLLHSAFWLEHRLWGDSVMGYHLINIALHAAAAGLVVCLVRRLSLPGAWLAGFIFALHPVCVEAVAWISEQKSTLSGVFYLASALTYLYFDSTRRRSLYFLALGFFVLALLSKTVTATLPGALLVVFWCQRGRFGWKRDIRPLTPWFVLGASAGLFTAWVEKTIIGAEGAVFVLTLTQHYLLAGRIILFDLGKVLWPSNLIFIYPRWTVNADAWQQYLFPIGVSALIIGLGLTAPRSRAPLAGFLIFAGTLFPVLGFFNVYPFLYSWVADHFLYLASLGIIVPLSSALTLAAGRISASRGGATASAAALLLALGVLTWRQSGIYRDAGTLYRETLARNPGCWLAHNNLGNEMLSVPGLLPEAIAHFEAALRLEADYPQAWNNLGIALSRIPGRLPEAIADFETALRIQPDYAQAHNNLGIALSNIPGRLPEAIIHFEAAVRIQPDYAQAHNNLGSALSTTPGRLLEAVSEYKAALNLQPDFFEARFNLGNTLSTIPGQLSPAIGEYRLALRIRPDDPRVHNNLASALSTLPGQLPEAISEYEAALQIDPGFADAHYNLGLALSKIPGRSSDAISEYRTALRLRGIPSKPEREKR